MKMMSSEGRSRRSVAEVRAALTLALVLAVMAAGCSNGKPAVSHESGKTIHDYCDRSDAAARAIVKQLEASGVLEPGARPRPGVQRNIRPSSKADLYVRWNVATYDAPQWYGSPDLLAYVVSRAVRKAGATLASQADAPNAVVFSISFSDRSLKGLADSLEAVRLVVPFRLDDAQASRPAAVPAAPAQGSGPEMYQDLVGGDRPDEPEEYVPKEAPLTAAEPGQASRTRARLAIVIDDLGNGATGTEQLFQIEVPLTVAVLPEGSRARSEATTASQHGFAVLLHQPMEPHDPAKRPGRGAIIAGMGEDEIREALGANLAIVPNAIGVNNHMGSKVTEDRDAMSTIMDEVFSRGLFFFDSRTTPNSAAPRVAREMGAPLLENACFLDHIADEEYVVDQIRAAARIAISRGTAAVIGHVRPTTVRALARMIPELEAAGVQLVRLDELMPENWKSTVAKLRKPTAETSARLTAEPPAQPAAEPPAEPSAELSAEPPAQPAAEPPAEPSAEPPGQPAAEPRAEPSAEPPGQPNTELPAEPSTSATASPTLETRESPTTPASTDAATDTPAPED